MEQNHDNKEVTPWKITLKVFEDKEPQHFVQDGTKLFLEGSGDGVCNTQFRHDIEPWLTALFQNEHLNLLAGSGLTCATSYLASKQTGANMDEAEFSTYHGKDILAKAVETSAKSAGREKANIEDQIRTANKLLEGLEILEHDGNDYGYNGLKS